MRKIYLFIFLFIAQTSFSQLLTFEFVGITGAEATVNSNTNGSGVQASVISRGAGLTAAANGDRFNSSGWTTNAAPDLTDYVEFTVTPTPGFTLNITSVNVQHQRSSTGPVSFVIRTSLDAYAANATNAVTITDVTTTQSSTFTFTSPVNTTSAVTIRLYAYSSEAASGTWGPGDGSGNDIVVNGTATSAINTITTGTITPTSFCIDAATAGVGTVGFSATGTFNTTFTAYLSDASGSFASPVAIGSAAVNGSNPTGTINISIPAGTPSGTGYRIRISATSPALTGSETTAFEIINGAKNVSNASVTPGGTIAIVDWTNSATCWEEVMIVAKAGSSVTATPSGDGTAYTASLAFGSGTPFDGGFVVYKGVTRPQTVTNLTTGTTYYFRIFTRRGIYWSTGVEVSATASAQPNPGDIVINQVSPDYGLGTNEYVELVNKTNNTYNLSGLALRYQSANGTPGSAGGVLSGVLQPRRFWLLSPDAIITVGLTSNLARDGSMNSGLATSGQIALVRISDGVIIDAVAYGNVTNGDYIENSPAPLPPADGGIRRVSDGYDTNNNSTDFITVDNILILLRNSASSLLPVRFSALTATQKGQSVQLNWSNATEENVTNYTIERSSNGRNFSPIGVLNARSNNNDKAAYSFTDLAPISGDNFYRIKATESDGKLVYTNVVRINTTKKGLDLVVYPNPVKGSQLNLQLSNLPAGKYLVNIYAAGGQLIDSRSIQHAGGNVSQVLPIPRLGAGLYTLQVSGVVSLQKTFLAE